SHAGALGGRFTASCRTGCARSCASGLDVSRAADVRPNPADRLRPARGERLNLILRMNATLPPRKVSPNPVPFEEQLKGLHWTHLDNVYTAARREIARRQEWRFGPARVQEVAKEAFDAIAPFT